MRTLNDSILLSYVEAALFTSVNNNEMPLDRKYSYKDIDIDTIITMGLDVNRFIKMCDDEDPSLLNGDYDDAARDFWLTRNGHGAGFGDGDWIHGDRLTEIAHMWSNYDLYIGDNGKIHGI